METISERIKYRLQEIRQAMIERAGKRGGINSDRADNVASLMEFMKEYTWPVLEINATDGERKELAVIGAGDADKRKVWATKVYNRRFRYWLGRTRHLNPYEIRDMVKQARTGTNPQALFNYLLKDSKRGH